MPFFVLQTPWLAWAGRPLSEATAQLSNLSCEQYQPAVQTSEVPGKLHTRLQSNLARTRVNSVDYALLREGLVPCSMRAQPALRWQAEW